MVRKGPAKDSPFLAACRVDGVDFTVGTEAADSITLTGQLKDANGQAIAERASVILYLADAATGAAITATAPDTAAASGSIGSLVELVTKKMWRVITNAAGQFDLVIGENAGSTWYPVIVMPSGHIVVGSAITFAITTTTT